MILTATFIGCATFRSFHVVTNVRFDPAKVGIYNQAPFYGKVFAQADTAAPLCVIGPHEAVRGSVWLSQGSSVLALVVPMYSDSSYRHWIGTALAVMQLRNGEFAGWAIQTVYFPDGTYRAYGNYSPDTYPASLIGTGREIDIPDVQDRTTVFLQIPNITNDDLYIVLSNGKRAIWAAPKRIGVGGPGSFYAKEESLGNHSYVVYGIVAEYVDHHGRVVDRRDLGDISIYSNWYPNAMQLMASPQNGKFSY